MLARVGNKPGAAAKVVSHGDVSQAWARKLRAGKRQRSQKRLAMLGRITEERSCETPFLRGFIPLNHKLAFPSGFCCFYAVRNFNRTSTRFTPLA